ncbi:Holliday junction resolvase RecU [uncultured Clostridium sp.]|uniref:Holliday junction resolvase RecU n=1 Tax=uncultured Clostridium sp. TaxID=59620 RepID=UPI002627F14F|nr:Holliday junction resolvase RecU [uncultured Clostridium sp.]
MKNPGKVFEEDIKKSVPKEHWIYRFKDGTANFSGSKNENVRFQAHNICDFMIMTKENLILLELKSHKGSSIPFSCIRKNQIEEMTKIEHSKIKSYFLLNFRDSENTYAVLATVLKKYIENSNRKSVPISWCEENGVKIMAIKKKIRYEYLIKDFLDKA